MAHALRVVRHARRAAVRGMQGLHALDRATMGVSGLRSAFWMAHLHVVQGRLGAARDHMRVRIRADLVADGCLS